MQQNEQKGPQVKKVFCGHDRKQHYARGLCRECYEKLRRGLEEDSDSDEENSQGRQSYEKQPREDSVQKKNQQENLPEKPQKKQQLDEQLYQERGKFQDQQQQPERIAMKQIWDSLKVENQNVVAVERGKKRGRPRIYPINLQKERRKLSNKQIRSQKQKDLIEVVDKFDDQYPLELNPINEQVSIANVVSNKAQKTNQKQVSNYKPGAEKDQTVYQNKNLNKDEVEKNQFRLDRSLMANISMKKEQIIKQKQTPQETKIDLTKQVLKKEQISNIQHEILKVPLRSESLIEKIIKKSGQAHMNNYQKGKVQETLISSKHPQSFEEQDVFEEEEEDQATEHRKDDLIKIELKDQKCIHKTIEVHQPLEQDQLREIYYNDQNQSYDEDQSENRQIVIKSEYFNKGDGIQHRRQKMQWNSENFSGSDDRDAFGDDQFNQNDENNEVYGSRQLISEGEDGIFGQEDEVQEYGKIQDDFDDNDQPMLSAKDFDSNDFLQEQPLVQQMAQNQAQEQSQYRPNINTLILHPQPKTVPIHMVPLPTILPDPRTLRPSNLSLPLQCGHHIKKNYIVQVCKGCLQRIFVRSQNPQLKTRPIFKRSRQIRDIICGHNEEHYARGLCRSCYKSVFWKNFLKKARDQYGWDEDKRKEAWRIKQKMVYLRGKGKIKDGQQGEELFQDDILQRDPQNKLRYQNNKKQQTQKDGNVAQPVPAKRPRICGRKSRTNICGHPQLKHCSHGLCIKCYQKSFAQKKNRMGKTKKKQDRKKKKKKILKRRNKQKTRNKQKKSKVDCPN